MPAYLIVARDPLIAESKAHELSGKTAPLERYYCEDLDFDGVFRQIGSQGLFFEERSIQYINPLDFRFNKKELERFSKLLTGLGDETTVLMTQVVDEETRSKEQQVLKKADFKALKEAATFIDLVPASEGQQAIKWVVERARSEHALAVNSAQAGMLIEAQGGRLGLVDAELRKLASLKSADGLQPVTDKLLASVTSSSRAGQFYALADAVCSGSPRAHGLLLEWAGASPEQGRLLAELRRRLLGIKHLRAGHKIQPPFFEQQLRQLDRQFNGGKLQEAIRLLAEFEYGMKGGNVEGGFHASDDLSALEILVERIGVVVRGNAQVG